MAKFMTCSRSWGREKWPGKISQGVGWGGGSFFYFHALSIIWTPGQFTKFEAPSTRRTRIFLNRIFYPDSCRQDLKPLWRVVSKRCVFGGRIHWFLLPWPLPRRACSQATTGPVNSCWRLKLDINYVIHSKWRRTMFCLQVCWLLLHSFKSILLFFTTNTSHSKEDLMSSRSCNLLVRDEGLLTTPSFLNLVKDDFGSSSASKCLVGQRTSRHGYYARYSPFANLL